MASLFVCFLARQLVLIRRVVFTDDYRMVGEVWRLASSDNVR